MNAFTRVSAIVAALATLSATAGAQTPPTAAPAHHGLLGGLLHHPRTTTGQGQPGGMAPVTGGIVGNKKSHVYHLPGDRGALPAAQNRVYFRSEAEAQAAGFHRAGTAGGGGHQTRVHRTPRHGMPTQGAPAPAMTH